MIKNIIKQSLKLADTDQGQLKVMSVVCGIELTLFLLFWFLQ